MSEIEQNTTVAPETNTGTEVITEAPQQQVASTTETNTISLPGADADVDTMNAFYKALGRPESFDKYEFEKPEGLDVDKTMDEWARKSFYKSGLSNKQANALFKSWNDLATRQSADYLKQSQEQIDSLKSSLGDKYESTINSGRQATQELGLDQESLNAIEKSIGTAPMIKLFAQLGKRMSGSEVSNFVGSNTPSTTMLSKDSAKAEIARLNSDKEFMQDYYDNRSTNHKINAEKMRNLFSIAYS